MLDKTDYIQPSMQKYDNIKVIALDADDTLWVNEPIFQQTQDKLKEVLSAYIEPEQLDERLYETERENLRLFCYGVKGFVLSMIETAVQLSEGKITGGEVRQIIDMGKAMLEHPVDLLDGVKETVETLSEYYELMVITKGDLFDQESKIARSGLADYFKRVEIVSDSEVMVRQMQGHSQVNSSRLQRLHKQTCQAVRRFEQVTFRHVLREENHLADALAAEALQGKLVRTSTAAASPGAPATAGRRWPRLRHLLKRG